MNILMDLTITGAGMKPLGELFSLIMAAEAAVENVSFKTRNGMIGNDPSPVSWFLHRYVGMPFYACELRLSVPVAIVDEVEKRISKISNVRIRRTPVEVAAIES